MPDSSHISPYTASCGGGLILNKDVYNMQPGEALQLKEEAIAKGDDDKIKIIDSELYLLRD